MSKKNKKQAAPTNPGKFSCPIGPGIRWHVGLEYKDCPLVKGERDMDECVQCKLKLK